MVPKEMVYDFLVFSYDGKILPDLIKDRKEFY